MALSVSTQSSALRSLWTAVGRRRSYAKVASSSSYAAEGRREKKQVEAEAEEGVDVDVGGFAVSSGISRPLSEILKQLNKKVPDSLVKTRSENGFTSKYIPWHIVNRIMNLHAPEWSGEVRSVTYSADAKSVSVVYRVTLYGTDAEIFRESIGTASVADTSYGDPVQKAEAMAFRRACARFGLGLHLYHEDLS
ncbi:DNA repair RAD52-like protein 1, mitochondrial [Pyrus communis]|uniref:DNA repair RAD52-like protein 1, mitochondrial n=1 Tax=Pyrus communis TaxID=23211 RepID=UPI0035C0B14F